MKKVAHIFAGLALAGSALVAQANPGIDPPLMTGDIDPPVLTADDIDPPFMSGDIDPPLTAGDIDPPLV